MVIINPRGYWENETDEGHGHDEKLANAIVKLLHKEKARHTIDVGCGDGYYTNFLEMHGISCDGYDGNPNTHNITMNKYAIACHTLDFSKDLDLDFDAEIYDWGICLEVGEHIPAKYEPTLFDNLTWLIRDGIILSWAIEGQAGDGHVNCRNNDYIISEMDKRYFYLDKLDTRYLRDNCSPYPETGWWFKDSLMVFRSKL